MPSITDSVGQNANNSPHDLALVQMMLRVIKKNSVSYLSVDYDGYYGAKTQTAINKYQNEHNLVTPNGVDQAGKINPNGETIKKLNAELPNAYNSVRIIEKTRTVYFPGNANDATNSSNTIANKQELDANFRNQVCNLVETMYNDYKIVLTVIKHRVAAKFC